MDSNTATTETITGAKTLELTPYDQQRKPHKAINDATEILISPRSLSSELCCPICLDLLTNTMTTKECLHRFCSDCITTALQRGNKECPTCRKKLVSKRSLRPDPNFDALISKIWPDRKEYEEMQEKAMQRFCRQSSVEALQRSIEAGMKAQAQHRRQRVQGSYDYEKRKRQKKTDNNNSGDQQVPLANTDDGESSTPPVINGGSTSSIIDDIGTQSTTDAPQPPDFDDVELILQPHPDLKSRIDIDAYTKQSRYLKTTTNATIDHLCSYLSLRIRLDAAADDGSSNNSINTLPQLLDAPIFPCTISVRKYAIDSSSTDESIVLDGDTTLSDVRAKHWSNKRPFQLEFVIDTMGTKVADN